jgi:hypothetical protein
MPQPSREVVFAALNTLLLAANWTAVFPNGLQNTDSRVMKPWEMVDSAIQPALYLQEGPQKVEQNTPGGAFGLNRWTWTAKVWVYFRRDAINAIPATIVNQVVDTIDQAILPPGLPGRQQTLASQNSGKALVTNVRITEVMFDEGMLDPKSGQVVVMIGLEILTSN